MINNYHCSDNYNSYIQDEWKVLTKPKEEAEKSNAIHVLFDSSADTIPIYKSDFSRIRNQLHINL